MDQLWNRLVGVIDQSELARLLGKILLAILVLVLFLILARVLRTTVRHLTDRASSNANLPILLSNLVYVGLLIVGALAIFSIFTGAGLSNLLTVLGLLSLAISLSVQDVLKNFVAGVYLLLEQPFSIGDRIKVRDIEGKIENIEIRTTRIHTDEGVQVFIPNSIVFSEVVTNRTAYRQRLGTLRFTIPAGDLKYAQAVTAINATMAKFEPAMISTDPAPEMFIESVTAAQTVARIEFWSPITAPINTPSELIQAISRDVPGIDINGQPVPAAPAAVAPK